MSEWVEGRVTRLVWRSPETGWTVLRLATDQGEISVVGDLAGVIGDDDVTDAFLAVEGRWESHPVHGRQFRATGVLHGLPRTLRGLELYLASSGVPGIGPVLASRIVETFGERSLSVIANEPERLAEVPGISDKRAAAITERWRHDEEGRATTVLLLGLGLSRRLVHRIRQRYGEDTGRIVTVHPFRLADDIRGVGFRTADALAARAGVAPNDPARVAAAVDHVLRQASLEGHTCLDVAQVRRALADLSVPADDLDAVIERRLLAARLRREGDRLFLPELYEAEWAIADAIRALAAAAPGPRIDDAQRIADASRWVGVDLDPVQRDAVAAALGGGVVVITGGPGTGKTTLVRVLVRAAKERGETWLLASPTGRAAKRLSEASGEPAKTVHRLLEFRPDEGGFQRGSSNPLQADAVLVDEASMLDVRLLRALLEAMNPGCALILVGDADQLPSVGPGRALGDIIDSGAVPVVRLQTIHRQAAQSGIVRAAAAINAGRVPRSGGAATDDFFVIDRADATQARDTLLRIVAERLPALGFDPLTDVQVLAPTRRGVLGTEPLARAIQGALNPDGQPLATAGERQFRTGDRVLCVRNRYDLEVFNGDVGVLVGRDKEGLVADFDGNRITFAWDDLSDLDLAWAMTVHKSQGSEYPAVVLALHDGHHMLLRRSLLYTAVTRAKRFLCIVGSRRALERAVRTATAARRHTALRERLSG